LSVSKLTIFLYEVVLFVPFVPFVPLFLENSSKTQSQKNIDFTQNNGTNGTNGTFIQSLSLS
jgi:glycopeptide antibiotics resistance protein